MQFGVSYQKLNKTIFLLIIHHLYENGKKILTLNFEIFNVTSKIYAHRRN